MSVDTILPAAEVLGSPTAVRGWQPYPVYRDSGIEWLGEIPEHWEVKRLKFVVSFYGGGTPSKADADLWIGDIPWVSPKDMKDSLISDTDDHISEYAVASSSTRLIPPGAVLVVVRSGILKHSIPVAVNSVPVALNQDMKALVPSSVLMPEYLSYLISGHQSVLLAEWRKVGATVESIEHELLANTSISVPSLPEQRAVIAFLDCETAKLDELIGMKERLIALLQEKRAALISHAVTKGLDPTASMKDSGVEWLGHIAGHWKALRIKFAIRGSLTYGANEPAELTDLDLPRFIRISDINPDGTLREDTFRSLPEEIAKPYILEPDDILLARSGATVGKHFLYQSEWGRACFAGYLIRLRTERSVVLPRFLSYFLDSLSYWTWIRSSFIQATIQNVSAEKYSNLVIGVPSVNEQAEIVACLDRETAKIDDVISGISTHIVTLREFRTALITAAVTGQIDVRDQFA